jgi:hypothetical protein
MVYVFPVFYDFLLYGLSSSGIFVLYCAVIICDWPPCLEMVADLLYAVIRWSHTEKFKVASSEAGLLGDWYPTWMLSMIFLRIGLPSEYQTYPLVC